MSGSDLGFITSGSRGFTLNAWCEAIDNGWLLNAAYRAARRLGAIQRPDAMTIGGNMPRGTC